MTYDFSQDNNFRAISQDVSLNDGMLKHAWVLYKGEKWYPVIVKDQQSGIRGFEVNFSGKWGKNESVGRKKLGLDELLTKLVDDSIPTSSTIRCKRPGNPERNGRNMSDLALSMQLEKLITGLRAKRSGTEKSAASISIFNGVLTEPGLPNSNKEQASPTLNSEQRDSITANDQETLERDTPSLKTDEREAVVKVRFGQGSFRELLLNYKSHGEKCWMSGIEGKRLLFASHIKPWSHCKEEHDSRGNPDNGLLLSALWDTVFDAGLISFDPDWRVVVSSDFSESARCALNLNEHSALPVMFRTNGRKDYLAYHHAEVFEYWKKAGSEQKVLP